MRIPPAAAILVLSLSALACTGGEPTTEAIVTRDSSGIAIVENDLLRLDASCSLGATPALAIGAEGDEGGEEYLLFGVNGVRRLSDGGIAIVNQRAYQVRWYGPDGRYVRAAGRQGEGPGEFVSPYTMHRLAGDTLYIGNTRPFQFTVFAPDGRYIRTVRPQPALGNPPGTFALLADGRMMLAINDGAEASAGMTQRTRRIQLHAADGAVLDTLAVLPNGRQGKIIPSSSFSTSPMFESYAIASALDSIVVLGHGAARELQIWSGTAEMKPVRLIRWDGGSREVTKADIDAEHAYEKRVLERTSQSNPQLRPIFEDAYQSNTHPDRPVADVMPAMSGIRLGSDGRIWVREYQPPSDTAGTPWIAFTRDGRFDCRLRTPRFSSFDEFGADFLLVAERDSVGVERVKQFPLSRP